MHLNYDHMSPMQFIQIFCSASSVQHNPEQLNPIYIVAHRWKEEIFSVPMFCHLSQANFIKIVSNFKGQATIDM